MKVYQRISNLLAAINASTPEWQEKHKATLDEILEDAPSGSGIDSGVVMAETLSTPSRLEFRCDFHHMDENGYYDGWSYHNAVVTPSLQFGFNLKITGKDRNNIKDYLHEVLHHWLNSEVK